MCSMVCGQRTPPSWTIDFNFFWLLHPTYSSFFWCIETGWFVRLNFCQKEYKIKLYFEKKESSRQSRKINFMYTNFVDDFGCSNKTTQPTKQFFFDFRSVIYKRNCQFRAHFSDSLVLMPLLPLFSFVGCHFMYWQKS